MDERSWRVVFLGAGLLLAFAWLASALWRAPKRRSRWQRLRELRRDAGEEPSRDAERDGDA
jgi:hypothetical protein